MDTVIYISPHTDQYGAERSMIANIKNVKAHGIGVLLIIPRHGRIEELLNKYNIDYIVEKFFDVINHENRIRLHYGVAKYIVNLYKAHKIKRILKKRCINPVLVHSNSLTSDFGIVLSELLKIPHIQHIRELGEYDFGMTFDMGIQHFAKVCSKSRSIICISDAVMNYYKQYLPVVKMVRIYNGVQANTVVPRYTSRDCSKPLQLVMVGRLSDEKGQLQAIKAVEILKDRFPIHLDLWGDGVNKEKYVAYISENGLDSVISLCGYSQNIPYDKYHAALICSKYEAFGRVTVEYMFAGLPVIGSNTGGTAEIILDGVTGFLYKQGNIADLAQKIEHIYSDEKTRIEMGRAGRNRAEDQFSEKVYCDKVYQEYKKVCENVRW